jgi:hypothetical protein
MSSKMKMWHFSTGLDHGDLQMSECGELTTEYTRNSGTTTCLGCLGKLHEKLPDWMKASDVKKFISMVAKSTGSKLDSFQVDASVGIVYRCSIGSKKFDLRPGFGLEQVLAGIKGS